MAYRNYIYKDSGREASFLIKGTSSINRDVGSTSVSEQAEVSSKALSVVKPEKQEKVGQSSGEAVDVESYPDLGKEEEGASGIGKRVRKNALGKRQDSAIKMPPPKKGKSVPPSASESPEVMKESQTSSTPMDQCRAIVAEVPEPFQCHRMMTATAPKGWIRQLNQQPFDKISDLYSCSVLQSAIVGNVLNDKAREMLHELNKCHMEVETLNKKVASSESEVAMLKAGVEDSEPMLKAKKEIADLKVGMAEQATEIAKLCLEVVKAAELENQVKVLTAKLEGAGKENQNLSAKCRDVISLVVPHVVKELHQSHEYGKKLGLFINMHRAWERTMVLDEVSAAGGVGVLAERGDYC